MRELVALDTSTLPPSRWRNGGGVTREIAQRAGGKGFIWRLSIADVETEGPFSTFEGMARILTVIEGDGLFLCDPETEFEVRNCEPFRFSGDAKIRSVLRQGKIRDFNVIFDPEVIHADVTVKKGPSELMFAPSARTVRSIFGVSGSFECDGVSGRQGTFVSLQDGGHKVTVVDQSQILLVEMTNIAGFGRS